MKAVSRTDTGKQRASNQDAFLIRPGAYPLYAVADGMGGHRGGDIASAMAVEHLAHLLTGALPSENAVRECIRTINRLIWERQGTEETLRGMGTTLTLVWEGATNIVVGHIGDSRAYLWRAGRAYQVTSDHSLVGELLRTGVLTPQAARDYPYRNIITRALGTEAEVDCDTQVLQKQRGDKWLICSDGLSEYLDIPQLEKILRGKNLETAADALLRGALDGGGRDNITLLLLEVEAC